MYQARKRRISLTGWNEGKLDEKPRLPRDVDGDTKGTDPNR